MTGSKLHANKPNELQSKQLQTLAERIKSWATELGFDQLGICDTDLKQHEAFLDAWIDKGFQGDMDYMFKHGRKRTRPELLVEGTSRVISVRMDYAPEHIEQSLDVLLASPPPENVLSEPLGHAWPAAQLPASR